MKSRRFRRFFKAALMQMYSFVIFFAVVAFVITCSFLLFFSGFDVNEAQMREMAPQVFINAIFIAFLFSIVDYIRRRIMVDRPAREIQKALDKMKNGDFSARIKLSKMSRDGNDLYSIAENVNLLGEELSGIETLRTDFISNVSHEMKTPLAVISNYARLLESDGITEEERREYIKGISDATRRLSDMMTNVLKLNRLENQQIYPKAEEFDLAEQLRECFLQFEGVWETKDVEIELDLPDEARITADAELLSLVWNNLLSNAFKFTEAGGRVSLSLTEDEKYVFVKVSDTGCGMSAEVGAHLFEKFYQGDTSRATEGNGLGLALVKRVIDIFQGEISVDSVLGEGSTFTVKIKKVAKRI